MKKILIVDDDLNILRVYKEFLTNEGFKVDTALSAEMATEHLLFNRVDLVLLDINMPDVNGILMSEALEEYDARLKVIVSSVYPVGQQKRWIKKAHGYYDKAQGTEGLVIKIQQVLGITALTSGGE